MSDDRPSAPPSLRSRIKPAADNDQDPIDLRAVSVQPSFLSAPTVPGAAEPAPAASTARDEGLSVSKPAETTSSPDPIATPTPTPTPTPIAPQALSATTDGESTAPPEVAPSRYAKTRRQEVTVQMSSRVALDIRDMADAIIAVEGGTLRSVLERAVRDLYDVTVGRQQ